MTIEFHCPYCGQILKTSFEKAGRQANCPGCSGGVTVPAQRATTVVEPSLNAPEGGFSPTETVLQPCPMCGGDNEAATLVCRHCGEDLHAGPVRGHHRELDEDAVEEIIPGGFFRRFWAWFVDMFLLFMTVGPLIVIAFSNIDKSFLSSDFGAIVFYSIIGFVGWLYYAFFECSRWRGTLGKKVFGLIVTDDNGERISFARASGRYFGKLLSALICYIGYLMAIFTTEKQALHDILSGCLVLKHPNRVKKQSAA